ncbi:MAG: CXXX repeat peptide modification system protein [Phycisphaerales bacterium]|nr:CXXX repeat peptide modification system protein [Phycisphaerales bacterium]
MNKKIVGRVTPEQRSEIQKLFERRNSLKELFMIVDPKDQTLYEKVVADMGATGTKFQKWWDDRAAEYHWESSKTGSWEIDFNTCEIFLLEREECGCVQK